MRIRALLLPCEQKAMDKAMAAIASALVLLLPINAQAALTQEFYTYGGHDAVVSAFNKVALIFGGSGYQSLFVTLATASLAALVIRVMMQLMLGGFKGDGNVAFGALIPWLLSVALFMGGVLPKGKLHIYDPVENKYQAVGGIPDVVILFASVSNKIERILVEQVTTSGDPIGFQAQAGGKGFMGLYSVSTVPVQANDSTLDSSIQRYTGDCVGFHSSITPGYVQEIRKTTTDLMTSFAKAASQANMTVLFSDSSPAGDSVSCKDAWTSIQTRLQVAGELKNNLKTACTEMGFNAETATELSDCQSKMSGVVNAQIQPGKTSMDFLRSVFLAQTMDAVLSSDNAGTAMSNFSILNKASATMSTVNSWLPTVRAVVLAVTISLTPFLALLMLTPMFGKALKFVAGSFFLLTIWGVVDATLHQFIIDYSNKLYSDVRQYGLGLDAIRFFPSSTEKILAMFGMVRASGLVLAGYIASNVVGLSASVGAAIGGKLMGDVTATGAQAEQQMLDPGAKAQARRSNQMSVPTETLANEQLFSSRVTADYAQQAGQMQHTLGAVEGAGGVGQYKQLRHSQGSVESFRGQGDVQLQQQFRQLAGKMGISEDMQHKMAAANINHGEALFRLQALEKQGLSGEAAGQAWMQGAVADRMQNSSTGFSAENFAMKQTQPGIFTGSWGTASASWDVYGNILSANASMGLADSTSLSAQLSKQVTNSESNTEALQLNKSDTLTRAESNSDTKQQIAAATAGLTVTRGSSLSYSEAINNSKTEAIRHSTSFADSDSKHKNKQTWAEFSAGAKIDWGVQVGAGGGARWTATNDRGETYTVTQSAEQAQATNSQISKSRQAIESQMYTTNNSETVSKAMAKVQSITGTAQMSEQISQNQARTRELRQQISTSQSKSMDFRTKGDAFVYRKIGEHYYGGGVEGDQRAIKEIDRLAGEGNFLKIAEMRNSALSGENITSHDLEKQLPANQLQQIQAPIVDHEKLDAAGQVIKNGREQLSSELHQQPTIPNKPQPVVEDPAVSSLIHRVEADIEGGSGVSSGQAQINKRGEALRAENKLAASAIIQGTKAVGGAVADDIQEGGRKIVDGLNGLKNVATGNIPDLPGRK